MHSEGDEAAEQKKKKKQSIFGKNTRDMDYAWSQKNRPNDEGKMDKWMETSLKINEIWWSHEMQHYFYSMLLFSK